MRLISEFFTCSKLLENVDLYVCLYVCLDLELCLDEVFSTVSASSTMLTGAISCHTSVRIHWYVICYVGGQLL